MTIYLINMVLAILLSIVDLCPDAAYCQTTNLNKLESPAPGMKSMDRVSPLKLTGHSNKHDEWERFKKLHGTLWEVEWNLDTGTPHRISGNKIKISTPITPRSIERVSRKILRKYRKLLCIDPNALVLKTADLNRSDYSIEETGTWYVRLQQVYDGVLVAGGSVRLIFRDKFLTLMGSDYYPDIKIDTSAKISKEEVLDIIHKDLPGDTKLKAEHFSLIISPDKKSNPLRYRLVWNVKLPVIRDDVRAVEGSELDGKRNNEQSGVPVQWQYSVDAHTGAIIDRKNLIVSSELYGTVTGLVYPLAPDDTQQEVSMEGITVKAAQPIQGFKTETDATGYYWFSGLNAFTTEITAQLKSPEVHIYNNETPDPDTSHHYKATQLPLEHNWNWSDDDPSPNDVETNAYYHVSFIRKWFSRGDPFNVYPVSPDGNNQDYVEAYVRDGQYCNAGAALGNGRLHFGSGYLGCVDNALCADIIYHEYAHLVIFQIYDDANMNFLSHPHDGAMNEGFADYFALSISGIPIMGQGCSNGRNIDEPDQHFPTDFLANNPHQSGRIISGSVWDTRSVLNGHYVDSLAFRALKQTPVSFYEYLGAFLEEDDDSNFSLDPSADNDLSNGTPNIDTICHGFFDKHGIFHPYCAGHTEKSVAYITYPDPTTTMRFDGSASIIPIVGTAFGSMSHELQYFRIEYLDERDLDTWQTAGLTMPGGGNYSIKNSELGIWDISGVQDGYYLIRLTVTDIAGTTETFLVSVIIDRKLSANWPPPNTDRLYFPTSPIVADMDLNYPGLEIVSKERWGDIYVWHADGTAVPGWPQRVDGWPRVPPSVADLNGDGTLEVIYAGSNGIVHVFNSNGTSAPNWPKTVSGGIEEWVPVSVGDLDQDGDLEIVVGTGGGEIHAWHHDGTIISGSWPIALQGAVKCALAIGDVDNDGQRDVIAVAGDNAQATVYAFAHDGTLLPGWPHSQLPNFSGEEGPPVLADFDGDGDLEIMVLTEMEIYMLDHGGSIIAGWPAAIGDNILQHSHIVLGDIDQNNAIDILLLSEHIFRCWKSDGSILSGFPIDFQGYQNGAEENRSPLLGDVDGNGDMEIVAILNHKRVGRSPEEFARLGQRSVHKLIATNSDGTLISGMPKYVHADYTPSDPVIADIDQDGDVEFVIGGLGVWIWDLPGTYSASKIVWPELRHDAQRSGLYITP